jgi:hypothetical protein
MEYACAEPAMNELPKSNGEGGCLDKGKIIHATVISARSHILRLSHRGRRPFGSYYWCPGCTGYHVTSNEADGAFRKL